LFSRGGRLTLSRGPHCPDFGINICKGKIMSAESLLVILLVGGIAGWIAGLIVQGTGFGIVADIALGIVGAFVGSWLLPRLGLRLGGGLANEIIIATIGALVILIVLGIFARRGGRGLFLTPPSHLVFVVSVVLALLAILAHYAGLKLPQIGSLRVFDILSIAYVVLLAGVMFTRL
jgi:uncharacterized membrane protein YeaQ/YmgE (transglycosylase-associated protein family)